MGRPRHIEPTQTSWMRPNKERVCEQSTGCWETPFWQSPAPDNPLRSHESNDPEAPHVNQHAACPGGAPRDVHPFLLPVPLVSSIRFPPQAGEATSGSSHLSEVAPRLKFRSHRQNTRVSLNGAQWRQALLDSDSTGHRTPGPRRSEPPCRPVMSRHILTKR